MAGGTEHAQMYCREGQDLVHEKRICNTLLDGKISILVHLALSPDQSFASNSTEVM